MTAPSRPARWHAHPYNRSRYYRLAAAAAPRLPRTLRMWVAGRVEPALSVSRGAEIAALQTAVALLERYVRAHWDQWFNFYDVWEPAA